MISVNNLKIKILSAVIALSTSLVLAQSVELSLDQIDFVNELSREHQFDPKVVTHVLRRAEFRQEVIDLMDRPAEKALNWTEYRTIFITPKRIKEGIEFARKHQELLDRAHEALGVPGHIITSILGVETSYGKIKGSFPVVDALTTLGFEYPRRAEFFRGQLKEFFLLACEESIRPFEDDQACNLSNKNPHAQPAGDIRGLLGSYAGAMGIGQFIPSSYRDFAIDFDGDEFRDIWNNEADAIGSVANYFKRHGWRNQHPALVDVNVDDRDLQLTSLANQTLELTKTVAEWKQIGVEINVEDDSQKAALFRFDTQDGAIYKLAFHDFYVITRYNRSRMYAAVVLELAESIHEGE